MSKITYSYGERREVKKDVEETREIEFVISSRSKDRHSTVLNMDGWQLDNFNRNGIVGYQHNVYGDDMCSAPNPDSVIGAGRAFIENDKLIGSVRFEPEEVNPLAEKIFRKVLFGSLRATSVGFSEIGRGAYGKGTEAAGQENETYYFAGQELLEFSIVNIPSNPDAVRRNFRSQTHNALLYLKRILGDNYSFADIERMTVGEILKSVPNDRQTTQTEVQVVDNSYKLKNLRLKTHLHTIK